jgi:hypothetical protein
MDGVERPAPVRRVIVVGGMGFFGSAAVGLLRARGLDPAIAARVTAPGGAAGDKAPGGASAGEVLRLDAEDRASVRSVLRPGDVVIDAAGPFQKRSAALVEGAAEAGCDVVDISDSIDHLLAVEALRPRIESAGIRVLTSCSSITTLAAVLVRESGVADPRRISVCLAPASRATARTGTSGSLAHSVGRPVRAFRGGRLVTAVGWSESRPFVMPPPIGRCRGYLMEGALAVTLPRLWPGLRETGFWVDTRVRGLNPMLALAARWSPLRGAIDRLRRRGGAAVARLLGSTAGGMLVEIEGANGSVTEARVHARRRSYLAAVAPAVVAATDLASGRGPGPGLVPHDRQVDPARLLAYLRNLGIEVSIR